MVFNRYCTEEPEDPYNLGWDEDALADQNASGIKMRQPSQVSASALEAAANQAKTEDLGLKEAEAAEAAASQAKTEDLGLKRRRRQSGGRSGGKAAAGVPAEQEMVRENGGEAENVIAGISFEDFDKEKLKNVVIGKATAQVNATNATNELIDYDARAADPKK